MKDVEKIIRDYIPSVIHLSLATCVDNKPWVCEVHFAYDEDLNLYFRSLTTRRHSQEIAKNPQVAGNIVQQFGVDDIPLGVYFEGTAEMLKPGPAQQKAFACIKARLHTSDAILEEATRTDGHQFYKISVASYSVFGVFEGSAQKLELAWHNN